MKTHEAEEIIACLPQDRTCFYYYPGRYAPMLLSYLIGDGMTIGEIKRSRFSGLLQKPVMKQALSDLGSDMLTPDVLELTWPTTTPEAYVLTLGIWGEESGNGWAPWDQTVRPGVNLVLRLNFSMKHDREYFRAVKPSDLGHPFEWCGHPIDGHAKRTLAWSRLDIDLESGEALIEEVQNDWVREAMSIRQVLKDDGLSKEGRIRRLKSRMRGAQGDETSVMAYLEQVLAPHARMWDESMLSASIWFLRKEIGIRRIFYHTFETGNMLKEITYGQPPRSIYSTLPRRFCFEETEQLPRLIETSRVTRLRRLRKQRQLRFYRLNL